MNATYVQKKSPAQKKDVPTTASILDSSSQSEALQRKADMANNAAQREEAPRPNNTGMPDNLKSGIESLSGFSMDDVRVHYNSNKPATVQALAYTQGTDIHVAPGQEKHLPHEAWHVAQQMAGRVSPTTNINGMPVNDNAGLEHEADVMGEKAVQRKGMKYENSFFLERNKVESVPIQRVIEVDNWTWENNSDEIKNKIQEQFTLDELKHILHKEVVPKMPYRIRFAFIILSRINDISFEFFFNWLREWNDFKKEKKAYKYTSDKNSLHKLIKDVFKYHAYVKYGWRIVGVGEYMTGDATGLGIAANVDPTITLKILPYYWASQTKDTPTLMKGGALNSTKKNVTEDRFTNGKRREESLAKKNAPELFRSLYDSSQVRISENGLKNLEDPKSLYGRRFVAEGRSVEEEPIKPWNKETYEATRIIGEKYKEKKEEIKPLLLPSDETVKKRVKIFKNWLFSEKGLNENEKCILLWQRRSGERGGAHKELDSHPIMLKRIAKMISDNFQDRAIILIGDKSICGADLEITSKTVDFHEYWNMYAYKALKLNENRNNQNYFLQLLSAENDAISIGMRSGSLESSALLGIKTIFIDDLGNNAEERMEYWAGKAAYERVQSNPNPVNVQGPIENYERLATLNRFDSTQRKIFDELDALKLQVETFTKVETAYKRQENLFKSIQNLVQQSFNEKIKNLINKEQQEIVNSEIKILEKKILEKKFLEILEKSSSTEQKNEASKKIQDCRSQIQVCRSQIQVCRSRIVNCFSTKTKTNITNAKKELKDRQSVGLDANQKNIIINDIKNVKKNMEEFVITENELGQLRNLLTSWITPESPIALNASVNKNTDSENNFSSRTLNASDNEETDEENISCWKSLAEAMLNKTLTHAETNILKCALEVQNIDDLQGTIKIITGIFQIKNKVFYIKRQTGLDLYYDVIDEEHMHVYGMFAEDEEPVIKIEQNQEGNYVAK